MITVFACNDTFEDLQLQNGEFQLSPSKTMERVTMHITSPAGGGKSYFASQYIQEYHKVLPKNENLSSKGGLEVFEKSPPLRVHNPLISPSVRQQLLFERRLETKKRLPTH